MTSVSVHFSVIGRVTRVGKIELKPTLPTLAIHSRKDRKNVFPLKLGDHRKP